MQHFYFHRSGCVQAMLLSLVLAGPAFSQEARPNTLAPEEVAQGWLLLFDGETEFGWKSDGSLVVKDGSLAITAKRLPRAEAMPASPFKDFELQFDYMVTGKPGAALTISQPLSPNLLAVPLSIPLPAAKESAKDPWVKTKLSFVEGRLTGSIVSGVASADAPARSRNDLIWKVPAACSLYLRNVKLRPLKLTSLFNGKDLTGWKEFPGKKSKFSVTPDGAIHIKNGPGDLRTDGKYGNFLLQLECFSNGQHLNSGVFFRCRSNEYQNGYEAQIRNQFTAAPTQEYTLEEYDPQTHKLVAKKKAKFNAVDYGTGAIYRRQPARKEVAKDGEWFTMTILADNNHFMTWVNGIQVADWLDNRPRSDNARTGCRLEAGHISLQGHDPTTDLKFRNIRIKAFE